MDKVDLSLVPYEDLMREMESRCECFVAAYFFPDCPDDFKFWKGKGRWADAVMLSDMLHTDCNLNWLGELKKFRDMME